MANRESRDERLQAVRAAAAVAHTLLLREAGQQLPVNRSQHSAEVTHTQANTARTHTRKRKASDMSEPARPAKQRNSGGRKLCEHGRRRTVCQECGGGSLCMHGRQRSDCKECGGGSLCVHGRRRSKCKECGGGSFCAHGRRRSNCKQCPGGH